MVMTKTYNLLACFSVATHACDWLDYKLHGHMVIVTYMYLQSESTDYYVEPDKYIFSKPTDHRRHGV